MNRDQAESVRARTNFGRPDLLCASCGQAPTCPMLHDQLWIRIWEAFAARWVSGEMPRRPLACSTPLKCRQLAEGQHVRQCEIEQRVPRSLLCLECAELALGRQLALDDLSPCVANYAPYAMQRRSEDARNAEISSASAQLAADLDEALDQIEKVPAIDLAIKTIRYVRDVLAGEPPVCKVPADLQLSHCGARTDAGGVCTVQGFRKSTGEFVAMPGSAHARDSHRDDRTEEEWEL